MEKNRSTHLQEVIFGSSDPGLSRQISRLEQKGTIRKIAPRLYSSNLNDTPEAIVRRNLFTILGHLYAGAVLSHRSALEFQPTGTGQLFLTYKYTRKATLPGITIRLLEGPGPIEGDAPLAGELYASQRPRAFLENLQQSRKPGPDSKTLTITELEEQLEQVVWVNGDEELNKIRDQARMISKELDMGQEFKKLNKLISALLSTSPSKILKSPVAAARAIGAPYDPARIELFERLFRELKQEFRYRKEPNKTIRSFRNFACFESYFSNYIEGTIFKIDEAKKIIQEQEPLPARHEDSHDILGTYRIVSSPQEMKIVPRDPDHFLKILTYRHNELLSAREDKKPGEFKDKDNFAGQTSFVNFELVRGTLIKSYEYYQALTHPFARAAYIMFVVSEVHPFLDGNGRIARIMMNAELVKENQSKIIIPTVYRDDYLGALRKLTRQHDPKPYLRMLSRAHEFSSTIHGSDMIGMQQKLEASDAFLEHTEGKLKILGH